MLIKITKKNNRNTLVCTREDGTFTKSELGPKLPFHDMAHYVMEKKFNIQGGFYGMIAKGYSVEQLSDKNIIKTLGEESWLSEILARALGSLHTRACSKEQFIPLIQEELSGKYTIPMPAITEETVSEILDEYRALIERWNALPNGGSVKLQF